MFCFACFTFLLEKLLNLWNWTKVNFTTSSGYENTSLFRSCGRHIWSCYCLLFPCNRVVILHVYLPTRDRQCKYFTVARWTLQNNIILAILDRFVTSLFLHRVYNSLLALLCYYIYINLPAVRKFSMFHYLFIIL